MKHPQSGLWHFSVSAALYLGAFFVAFAPYAFIERSPEAVASTFSGIGGWAAIAAILMAVVATLINLLGIWRSIGGLKAGITKAPLGLVANAFPAALTLYFVAGLIPGLLP